MRTGGPRLRAGGMFYCRRMRKWSFSVRYRQRPKKATGNCPTATAPDNGSSCLPQLTDCVLCAPYYVRRLRIVFAKRETVWRLRVVRGRRRVGVVIFFFCGIGLFSAIGNWSVFGGSFELSVFGFCWEMIAWILLSIFIVLKVKDVLFFFLF